MNLKKKKEKTTALATTERRDEATIDVSGEALLKLVNLLFDTPPHLLHQLTELSRASVLSMSIMMMREKAINRPRDENGKLLPLSRLWREDFMGCMRSVGRRHFMVGSTLAEGQLAKEEEKAEEEYELP